MSRLGCGLVGVGVGAALTWLWMRCRSNKPSDRAASVHSVIAQHRSIRKFSDEPVERALLDQLLHVAMRSSNNGNMQTYSVIVTQDPAALEHLSLVHDNSGIAKAGALITFVCDWSRMTRWCALSGGDNAAYSNFNAFLTGALDCMVTAQSFVLAAEATGLGACFLGSTIWETDRLNKHFQLPESVHVVTSVMVGWPAETPALRARLPTSPHIHKEKYQELADEQVVEHYAARECEGWERYKRLYGPVWQTKLESHGLKNLGQVYTCLKYSGQDFRLWSRRLLASIELQGFGQNAATEADASPCSACGKWSHCIDPERLPNCGDVQAAYRSGS